VADASAIIVQCPTCEARFHLARERVPAKGARVRCSRCQHRFFVSASGEVGESNASAGDSLSGQTPGSKLSAAKKVEAAAVSEAPDATPPRPAPTKTVTGFSSRPSPGSLLPGAGTRDIDPSQLGEVEDGERSRSPWSMRAGPDPKEDQSLDNPEFLFEPGAEDEPGPGGTTPAPPATVTPLQRGPTRMLGLGDDEAGPVVPAPARPKLSAIPGPSRAAIRDPASAETEIPDIRAQRDELAAQRAMAALKAVDDEDLDQLDAPADDAAASGAPSLVTRNEDWAETASDSPKSSATASLTSASESPGDWAMDSSSAVTLQEGARASSHTSEPQRAERVSHAVSAAPTRGERSSVTHARAPFETSSPERERVTRSLGGLLALAVGGLLLLGGAKAAYVGSWRIPPGPPQVEGAGWTASDLTAAHLRAVGGERLLVIRGSLRGEGDLPSIEAVLVDGRGKPVSEPHRGWPVRLADARLRSEDRAALEVSAVRSAESSNPSSFTIVVPNPSDQARRFALSLSK